MPKEAFGGGDDNSGNTQPPPQKKKTYTKEIEKFGLSPDFNIRDVFWKILASYAATKKPGMDLSTVQNDRFALMRATISVLSGPHSSHYGLPPKFIAMYSIMMMVDGGWEDALVEFIMRSKDGRQELSEAVALGLKKIVSLDKYKEYIRDIFISMLRGKGDAEVITSYISQIDDADFIRALKKELGILARGDIGQTQLDAIKALSLLSDDNDVKSGMIAILSHWDAGARAAAAEALLNIYAFSKDPEIKEAATKRQAYETDEKVKELLEKIASSL